MKAISTEEARKSIRQDLLERFSREFSFRLAVEENEREKVFSLRHEVFLKELHYNMEEDSSHHLELDEYDDASIHCLIKHKRTNLPAGCLRLVIPSKSKADSHHLLPVEVHGGDSLDHKTFRPSHLPRERICEVSRLAISRDFRGKTTSESTETATDNMMLFKEKEKQTFPLIVIGLFLCTYALVGLTGRHHVFAMMEPRLPRLLALSGFHFTKVGKTIDFHGKRNAFYIDHSKAEKEIHEELIPLYLHIQNELTPQLEAAMPRHELTAIL
ncbi:PEP-CTERM/exosortase system-associated acyltransferase [Halomonas sp. C05BenzN]|uniref:PEP-CTERM/exosortase system-associated acyltransferase n=1 Tax=Halomonas sp. C05BenzN TaxID=3411041 RepID=UPI003B9273D2